MFRIHSGCNDFSERHFTLPRNVVKGFEDLSSGIRRITSLLTFYVVCLHLPRQRNLGAYETLSSFHRTKLQAQEGCRVLEEPRSSPDLSCPSLLNGK